MVDDEDQRAAGKAGEAAECAHDGALLIAGAPGQLVGALPSGLGKHRGRVCAICG